MPNPLDLGFEVLYLLFAGARPVHRLRTAPRRMAQPLHRLGSLICESQVGVPRWTTHTRHICQIPWIWVLRSYISCSPAPDLCIGSGQPPDVWRSLSTPLEASSVSLRWAFHAGPHIQGICAKSLGFQF